MSQQTYIGGELDLFAHASNWKRYWSSRLRPYLGTSVCEVGAGIGINTALLLKEPLGRWTCLEPDPKLSQRIKPTVQAVGIQSDQVSILTGTLADLPMEDRFDTLVYIDVLEHIQDDKLEVGLAASRLLPGGRLIVLAPAHQRLFSEFDQAIGHFRRYNLGMLRSLTPSDLVEERGFYLDSVGMLASSANRFLLRQTLPTLSQIQVWDRFMVPLSRLIDPFIGYGLGKTVVMVWRRK